MNTFPPDIESLINQLENACRARGGYFVACVAIPTGQFVNGAGQGFMFDYRALGEDKVRLALASKLFEYCEDRSKIVATQKLQGKLQ